MIFAAGMGTRLKPITDTLPKALVPVRGMPLIEHVCRKLMIAGISEVVVNVHHFADKIEQWICDQDWIAAGDAQCHDGQLYVQVSDERAALLETGGAIFHARAYLQGCGSFLVHNVDILSNLDISWFFSSCRPDALATLLVSERETSRYLLFEPDTMRLVGWTNIKTGEVRSPYHDLVVSECRALAFSGIHVISDKVFDAMDMYVASKKLDEGGVSPRFSIIDFYLSMIGVHDVYGVVADDLKLIDVGKLETLAEAQTINL